MSDEVRKREIRAMIIASGLIKDPDEIKKEGIERAKKTRDELTKNKKIIDHLTRAAAESEILCEEGGDLPRIRVMSDDPSQKSVHMVAYLRKTPGWIFR
jgi:predicted DNA-binding helix-hairpin-helix protein